VLIALVVPLSYCSRLEDGNHVSLFGGLVTLTAGAVIWVGGCDHGTSDRALSAVVLAMLGLLEDQRTAKADPFPP